MRLGTIATKLYSILDKIELSETGEISIEDEKSLAELEVALVDGADEVGEYILTKEMEISQLKIIGNSYLDRAKAEETKLKSFKGWLARLVDRLGKVEKTGAKWLRGQLVGIKDSSKWKVKVLDDEKIPLSFKKSIVSVSCSTSDALKVVKKLLPMKEIEVEAKNIIEKKKLDEYILVSGFDVDGTQKIYENSVLITGYKKTAV